MELWIRSQDKMKLCQAHDLIIRENRNEDNTINYEIQDIYTMGKYPTKERALEVLNDIQKTMHLKDMYINDRQEVLKAWTKFTEEQICDIRTKMSVYEMPQE